jgi:hypothetical protein
MDGRSRETDTLCLYAGESITSPQMFVKETLKVKSTEVEKAEGIEARGNTTIK